MAKISKQAAGYVHFEGTDYHCEECYKFMPKQAKRTCAEVEGAIAPDGGCNTFVKGYPAQIHVINIPRKLSQLEAGYIENKAGFACKRCEHFDRQQWLCEKVQGEIRPGDCCNLWEKSPVFGEIA